MHRWTLPVWLPLAAALALAACGEKLVQPDAHIIGPDSLRATVGDTLEFLGVFTGNPRDVARHNWDFNSDGIFDFEFTNFGFPAESVLVRHAYGSANIYTATLQVTTVDNRLFRTTTRVRITNEIPVLSAVVPETAVCGETFTVTGHASDDAGRNAFWDLDGDGIPDRTMPYVNDLEFSVELAFDEPGNYPISFGASDNDGHVEREFFNVVVGTPPEWEAPSTLGESRADHAGVAYGDEIFIFGGRQGQATLGSVEIYDPVADALRPGAPMPTPRWGLKAEVLHDLIYVVGGVTAGGQDFRGIEIYDPVADTWSVFPSDSRHQMRIPKRGFSMLQVGLQFAGGDSLLVFGGWRGAAVSDTSVIFNARVDTFSLDKTRFMRTTRVEMGAVTAWAEGSLVRGQLYAIGGSSDGATPSSRMEAFNPSTGFWSNEEPMPTARFGPAAAFVDGKIYVFGGALELAGATDVVEVFSLAEERWDTAPLMPVPRKGAVAVTLNGRIYLIGGATPASNPHNTEGSADIQVFLPWRCAP